MGQFVYVIRKRIKLAPERAIFVFVNEVLSPIVALVSAIYEEHKYVATPSPHLSIEADLSDKQGRGRVPVCELLCQEHVRTVSGPNGFAPFAPFREGLPYTARELLAS